VELGQSGLRNNSIRKNTSSIATLEKQLNLDGSAGKQERALLLMKILQSIFRCTELAKRFRTRMLLYIKSESRCLEIRPKLLD
jgi:hypothetical protein